MPFVLPKTLTIAVVIPSVMHRSDPRTLNGYAWLVPCEKTQDSSKLDSFKKFESSITFKIVLSVYKKNKPNVRVKRA